MLEGRLARQSFGGLTMAQLVIETGWPTTTIRRHLTASVDARQVLQLGKHLLHAVVVGGLRDSVISCVENFHQRNPLMTGISKEQLRETVAAPPDVLTAALELLAKDKKLELVGELVRLPGRGVVMKDEEAESKKIIEQAFASAGLQVPALYTVLAGLKVDKVRAQKIVTLLLRDKVLVKISDDLVFHQSTLQELRRQIAAYKTKAAVGGLAKIDVGKFKELTGVSRKYAIPLLEYLDRERVTKRVGDERVIL